MPKYIVLCGQVVGGSSGPFEVIYNFDGKKFADRQAAIEHGLKERGSDDFNIGVVNRKKLVSLDWMNTPVETNPSELRRIAEQIVL